MADDSTVPAQEDGMISIALSPMQLAAVLDSASISAGETLSNHIWGAVGTIGGVIELVGSAALLVDPDPSISKVVGCVGIIHGSDVTATSWSEMISGEDRKTLTAQAATVLATRLGLDPRTADIVGVAVDIVVPTGVMAGVARSQGLFRLANKPSASAHALRDHVGKSLADMLKRFTAKPSLEATASFRSIPEAEAAVSQILRANKSVIQRWAASQATKPLPLSMRFAGDVGEGVLNPAKNPLATGPVYAALKIRTVTVVLARTTLHGRTWYVLTAYPDILRDLGLIR